MSNVRADSANGILLVGRDKNLRDVKLRDWSIKLKYGRNRPLFKPLYDLSPAPNISVPDPMRQIPWLFAEDVQGLRAAHVRCSRADGGPDFSMESITTRVGNAEFVDCTPISQPRGNR